MADEADHGDPGVRQTHEDEHLGDQTVVARECLPVDPEQSELLHCAGQINQLLKVHETDVSILFLRIPFLYS